MKEYFEQKLLNKRATSIQIPQSFLNAFPDMSVEKAHQYFDKYVKVITNHIIPIIIYSDQLELNISIHKLMVECGEFRYKKTRHYVWNEFKDRFPFFIITQTGSNLNGQQSTIKLNNSKVITMLINRQTPEEIYNQYVDENDEWDDAQVIDMNNLEKYIAHTEYKLENETINNVRDKLTKYLNQAHIIYNVGIHTEGKFGTPCLPMISQSSVFGRTYYKGLSIQSLHKVVREAVIGPHYQYDINAAVYGIKLGIYNNLHGGESNIINSKLGTYTREYLRDKNKIRKRLAVECLKDIYIQSSDYKDVIKFKEKIIKQALTAISFGARLNTGYYDNGKKCPALVEIIMNKEAREKFINDYWVKKFVEEQTMIDDAIIESYIQNGLYDYIKTTIKAHKPDQRRISKAMILSYIFQHMETQCMDVAEKMIDPDIIIGKIHDAILTKKPIPIDQLDNIYGEWGASLTEFLKFECEKTTEWMDVEKKINYDNTIKYEEDHRKRIQQEEYLARQHFEGKPDCPFIHKPAPRSKEMDLDQKWDYIITSVNKGKDISNDVHLLDLQEVYGLGFENELTKRFKD